MILYTSHFRGLDSWQQCQQFPDSHVSCWLRPRGQEILGGGDRACARAAAGDWGPHGGGGGDTDTYLCMISTSQHTTVVTICLYPSLGDCLYKKKTSYVINTHSFDLDTFNNGTRIKHEFKFKIFLYESELFRDYFSQILNGRAEFSPPLN